MTRIYTDGSYNKAHYKNKVAYSAFIPELSTKNTNLLGRVIYGYTKEIDYVKLWNVGGEILAVLHGIEFAIKHTNDKDLHIYYDYIGLANWADYKWIPKKIITKQYRDTINEYRKHGVNIVFHKVAAHTGNIGNELADVFAKKALTLPTPGPHEDVVEDKIEIKGKPIYNLKAFSIYDISERNECQCQTQSVFC